MKEVVLDSTCGTNEYNLQLTTLLATDEHGEGYPGAFCYSNTATESSMCAFLRCLQGNSRQVSSKLTGGIDKLQKQWRNVRSLSMALIKMTLLYHFLKGCTCGGCSRQPQVQQCLL